MELNSTTNNDGPIFIVGAPRSGTTLLQYILRSHPRISLPTGESHYIIPLMRSEDTFGDLSQVENIRKVLQEMYRRSANFLETDLHGIRFDVDTVTEELFQEKCFDMRSIVTRVFEKNAEGEGKARWGDKTPYYVLHMPRILDWYPNAQFIHIIRDGRDCALSLMSRKHDFSVYNFYFAAKYWQHYVDIGQLHGKNLAKNQYLEIRYEDLLKNQRETLQSVCQFLNEEFTEDLIDFKKSGEAGKTPLLQKPVQKDNTEKWRKKMSKSQMRIFESAAGDTLQRNNYPIATHIRKLPLPVRAFFRFENELERKFYASRRKNKK